MKKKKKSTRAPGKIEWPADWESTEGWGDASPQQMERLGGEHTNEEIKGLTDAEAECEPTCVVTWMLLDGHRLLNGVARVSDLTRWLDHLRSMPIQMGLSRANRIREDGEGRWIVSGSRADGMARCGDPAAPINGAIVRAAQGADEWDDMFEVVVVPGAAAAAIIRAEEARIAHVEAELEAEGEFIADLDRYGLLGVEAGQS